MSVRLTYGLPFNATDAEIDAKILEHPAGMDDANQRLHWVCMENMDRNGFGHGTRFLEARARNPGHRGSRCYDSRHRGLAPHDVPPVTPAKSQAQQDAESLRARLVNRPPTPALPPVDHAAVARERELARKAQEEAAERCRREKHRAETHEWYRRNYPNQTKPNG